MNPLVEEAAATEHKLAILQAYPLGTLEVVFTNWRNKDDTHPRGRLVGLFITDVDEYAGVDFGEHDRGLCEVEARYCIPCLRDFAALCTPLDDGTGRIPAVEVAKLVAGSGHDWQVLKSEENLVHLKSGEYLFVIKHIIQPEWGWHFTCYLLTDSLRLVRQEPLNPGAAYDWLRANHFAAPVNGRPMQPGRDYLPK